MILTTIQIQRPDGTIVASGIAAQIELAAPRVLADEGGARPYLLFDLLIEGIPPAGVRGRDLILDEQNSDPLTGTNARYRVITAEVFDREHCECRVQQIVGV